MQAKLLKYKQNIKFCSNNILFFTVLVKIINSNLILLIFDYLIIILLNHYIFSLM